MTTNTNNTPTNKDASHDDGVTDTNNTPTNKDASHDDGVTDTNNTPTNKDASHDDGVTDTNNIVTNDSDAPVCVTFDPKLYAGYMRSASANRASTFATLYANTVNYPTFLDHADKLALAFSTSSGIDTATLGLVAIVIKLPMAAYDGLEAKARLNVQVKPSLKLEDEFAKLLVPFLTALATVSKYCTVS